MVRRQDERSDFDTCFRAATGGLAPFPFQRKFAKANPLPEIICVPTGLGKTAMAVVGWLWRRRGGDEALRSATPRRLIYCLPTRVLVEQTAGNARQFVERLLGAGLLSQDVRVHVLMGGEDDDEDWDLHPEREAILVGTQDMLLSRALNRGYAATRSRWPMQFGLLNTDCLWIFDEIQLMGAGLATTTQLEAFRRLLPGRNSGSAITGHGCRSVWMSATMQKNWLTTVDFRSYVNEAPELKFDFPSELLDQGLDNAAREHLEKRWEAKKRLEKIGLTMDDASNLAANVLDIHREACAAERKGTRTIIVINTVRRACELYEELNARVNAPPEELRKGRKRRGEQSASPPEETNKPDIILLHSRFRPDDRKRKVEAALAEPPVGGTIVVSTQVIEAGVDVSASTLFTELAPWASLVQRFGRCNRSGDDKTGLVYWIDRPGGKRNAELTAPYNEDDLKQAAERLKGLQDVGLKSLPDVDLPFEHVHVVRRRDLEDLFDTTPDLAGNDIDIDRFVREVEDSDVRVFWREWEQPRGFEPPPEEMSAARHGELCPAPIGSEKNPGFRQFVKLHRGRVWRWSFLDKAWEKCDGQAITPGQVYLVHSAAGGYDAERGWAPGSREPVHALAIAGPGQANDGTDADRYSRGLWQTLPVHNAEVQTELNGIRRGLVLDQTESAALRHAAVWHDRGKAHPVFQQALPDSSPDTEVVWAKGKGPWKRYSRRHFRHELVSALAVLDPRNDLVPDDLRNLVAYLVAAHHGKVRLSIRSLPGETRPAGDRRFARGVWDGDTVPEAPLNGVTAPAVELSLELMELGLCEKPPFAGLPSWAERMLGLRDRLGPFRLAYLEAILRAADIRASRAAEESARGTTS